MDGNSPAGSVQMILVARTKSTDSGSIAERHKSIILSRVAWAEIFKAHFPDNPLPSPVQRSQKAKANPADNSLP
jgi:hypothetical protein